MKVLAIILSLCLSQIVCVLGQAKGNCSDSVIASNCDNNCYNYSPGEPIQYGTCTQTVPDNRGYYWWNCKCDFLTDCPKANQQCIDSCNQSKRIPSCTYPSKGIICACGRQFNNNPRVYWYYQPGRQYTPFGSQPDSQYGPFGSQPENQYGGFWGQSYSEAYSLA